MGPGVTAVTDLTPVSAIEYLRSTEQVNEARLGGVSISSFDENYIRDRLRVKPDFAMLQYTLSMDDLRKVAIISREYGIDVYPPLLIITSKSARTIGRILNMEITAKPDPVGDALERARELLQYFPGIYLSSPGDFNSIIEVARALRKYL
ncbi:hypothetical protein [Vulcanisaeta souniana]|uniref:hypothetical protein n=1 Tax=Vulcanisaeta souniana TaxID=164452 RepID=UPI000AD858A3|nr:hypothetical protein [Vulcanisaeta souniana]